MKMSKKMIGSLVGFVLLFNGYALSQGFVQNISSYPSISLEAFIKNHPNRTFSIKEVYPDSDFKASAQGLENLYFAEVGSSLKKEDSLEISGSFKNMFRDLSKQYKKTTKRLIKKIVGLDAAIGTSDSIIEPRYVLTIGKAHPDAFITSLVYILTDRSEGITYRLTP